MQNGQIVKISNRWYVRFRESRNVQGTIERKRVSHCLGSITTRGKHPPADIKQMASDYMAKRGATKIRPEQIVTLVDFAERIWLPHVEQYEKPSTVRSHRNRWENHLRAHCDGIWLREMRCCDVQQILDAIARSGKLGKNSLKRMKAVLSAIFSHAKQQGYYDGANPAHDVKIPASREPKQTHAHSLETIRAMLSILPEPAATIVAVAGFAGLREGEIEGLEWEDYSGDELHIRRSVWEGHVTTPKTDASADVVPVIKPLALRLEMHRLRCGNPQTGPIFATSKGTYPSLSNVRTRQVLPALTEAGIQWHGWHAFRRGLATNLHELGVPDKIIQKVLRHRNVSVTQACYIQPRDPAIAAAMRTLEEKLDTIRTPEAEIASVAARVN